MPCTVKTSSGASYRSAELLGEGTSATVRLGFLSGSSTHKVAMKFFRCTEDGRRAYKREKSVLRSVFHRNLVKEPAEVVQMQNERKQKGNVLLIQYAENGDLFEFIANNGPLREEAARTMTLQLIDGIEALHKSGVIHRDLKPENILLDKSFTPLLCDFGFSALKTKPEASAKLMKAENRSDFTAKMKAEDRNDCYCTMKTKAGSLGYMAPEILEGKYHDERCDIWSLGVNIFVMVCGFPPYTNPVQSDFWFEKIKNEKWDLFWMAHGVHVQVSEDFKSMIEQLLCTNPSRRISLEKLRETQWVRGLRFSKIELLNVLQKQKLDRKHW